eukprot:gnl/MRDRNA2_/MRDRNA2_95676_c0_seq1.p1 gnl/MRDRNA2_/MRDRNA2_95676_c0~~gnl/MRDRNA2_/MRDRNA2_95676_c0_seq1.p1  ORF type:complete len:291 (+),score=46.17 gnl/MRDRNA2_/MRDRNA2_95676_c0_seq1:101-973(+)
MCLTLSLCASPQVDTDGEVNCVPLTKDKMCSVNDVTCTASCSTQDLEPLVNPKGLEDQKTVDCFSSFSPVSCATERPAECTQALKRSPRGDVQEGTQVIEDGVPKSSWGFKPSAQLEDQSTEACTPSSQQLKMQLEDESTEGCTPSCSPVDSPRSSLSGNDAPPCPSPSDHEFKLTPRELEECMMTELMLDMIYRVEETQSLESISERSSDSTTLVSPKCPLPSFIRRKRAMAGTKGNGFSMSMPLCSVKRTVASHFSRRVSMTVSTVKRSLVAAKQYRLQRRSMAIASG